MSSKRSFDEDIAIRTATFARSHHSARCDYGRMNINVWEWVSKALRWDQTLNVVLDIYPDTDCSVLTPNDYVLSRRKLILCPDWGGNRKRNLCWKLTELNFKENRMKFMNGEVTFVICGNTCETN